MKQRIYPNETLNPEVYEEVRKQAISQRAESSRYKSGQEDWELVGPYNIGGRITDVEMHPTDTETIYVAAASGGIYKSPDRGVSWEQVFDNHIECRPLIIVNPVHSVCMNQIQVMTFQLKKSSGHI